MCLFVVYSVLFVVRYCSLFIGGWVVVVVCCDLSIVVSCRLWFVVCGLLLVMCCASFVVVRLLFVACC